MNFFDFTPEQEDYILDRAEKRNALLGSYATKDHEAVRAHPYSGDDSLRGPFSVDIDKILHNPFYNRYTDKTQVFSFYRNDDITRRALHVQLVARIAGIIGRQLDLNTDLIEAMALGHDIGHTPFGHEGERFLSSLYHDGTKKHKGTGRYFNHNVHSVRTLMNVSAANLTLQTYDGILCHNGEKDFDAEYYPGEMRNFEDFYDILEKCYTIKDFGSSLRPSTLEGCVVRISDVIAYASKDRQDALKAGFKIKGYEMGSLFGESNGDMISCVTKNLVKNSLGKPYLKMDKEVVNELMGMKSENGRKIYGNDEINKSYKTVRVMMELLYDRLLDDVLSENMDSVIFRHHILPFRNCYYHKNSDTPRENIITEDKVVDFIASMTDDYFIDLFRYEFPESELTDQIEYVGYFDEL